MGSTRGCIGSDHCLCLTRQTGTYRFKTKEGVLDTISCDFAGLCLCGYKGKLHRIMEEKFIKS